MTVGLAVRGNGDLCRKVNSRRPFSGIRPIDLPGFILAQGVGSVIAVLLFGWLLRAQYDAETTPAE